MMHFLKYPLVQHALEHFDKLDATDSQTGDRFFETFGAGNNFCAADKPFERFQDYEELLILLQKRNKKKYDQIHKGTPFFFLSWLAFDLRNYEKALFYMDAAISEDVRKDAGNWQNTPASQFLKLSAEVRAGQYLLMQSQINGASGIQQIPSGTIGATGPLGSEYDSAWLSGSTGPIDCLQDHMNWAGATGPRMYDQIPQPLTSSSGSIDDARIPRSVSNVAWRVIDQIRALLSQHMIRFNSISSLSPLCIEDFVIMFVEKLMIHASSRTIISAFYVFLMEAEERMTELRLKSSQGSTLGPIIAHLFSGGLIFESLLKLLYPNDDGGQSIKVLGNIYQTHAFKADFGGSIHTTSSSLQDILDSAIDNSFITAFSTISKLRNTTGHNLIWDNVFESASNYEVLVNCTF
jgi:hypothetical protein